MRVSLHTRNVLALCGVMLAVLALAAVLSSAGARHSVELGIAEHSPLGNAGGMVVPASCPSYSHTGGDCNAEEGDMCFNIAGWQAGPPGGYYLYETPGVYRLCCPNGYTTSGPYTCVAPPPPAAPTVTITGPGGSPSSSANVLVGNTATITWSCPSPNTSNSNTFSSNHAAASSNSVTVTANTTYTVVCDQTGTQASVTAVAINPGLSLVANPSRVHANDTSVLTWSASGVTSCTLSGPGTTDGPVTASGGGAIASRNKTTAAITGQSTFTLTCQTSATPVSASVSVQLVPIEIEI